MTESRWLSVAPPAQDYSHQPQHTEQSHYQHQSRLIQSRPRGSASPTTSDSSASRGDLPTIAPSIGSDLLTTTSPQYSELLSSSLPTEFDMSFWDCSPESDQPLSEHDLRPWISSGDAVTTETVPGVRDAKKERRRQQNRMAQHAYRVRQQSTLDALRAECDQLRKENVELKEQLMHQENALSMDLQSISGGSASDWQWPVEYGDEEQSTSVTEPRPSLASRGWTWERVLCR